MSEGERLYDVIACRLRDWLPEYPPLLEMTAEHRVEIAQRLVASLVPGEIEAPLTAGELRSLGYNLVMEPGHTMPPDHARLVIMLRPVPEAGKLDCGVLFCDMRADYAEGQIIEMRQGSHER